MSQYVEKFIMDGQELIVRDPEANHDGGGGGGGGLSLEQIVDALYPVGAVIFRNDSADPNSFIGVGTWVKQTGSHYLRVGTGGQTGGSNEVTLSAANMPSHTHTIQTAGQHTHDATVSQGGMHNHTASTGDAGDHTHSIEVQNAGTHTHKAAIKYEFNQVQSNTTNGVSRTVDNGSNESDKQVTIADAGDHTHAAIVTTAGEHNHTVTIGTSSTHNHSVTNDEAGGHTHTASSAGSGEAFTITPEYREVAMWLRTA